jgi:hypothetical protein
MTNAVNIAQSGSNNQTMRNRIINGAMTFDQRNAGASVTPANAAYTLDRWCSFLSQSSKYTVQQNAGSVTPPAGFNNYLGVTSTSAYSVLAGDFFLQRQYIEGFNFADMAWGTANAQPVTLSFWVRSSLTGTFGGAVSNSASNRSYPFSYTISAANTWEQKSITIAGDTTGTWVGATNGTGLKVDLAYGVGSTFSGTAGSWSGSNLLSATGATSVVGTNGATFYITGVQLEEGTAASPFENRLYTTELSLCQRYFQVMTNGVTGKSVSGGGGFYTSAIAYANTPLKVTMRTAPTISATSGTNYWGIVNNGATTQFNAFDGIIGDVTADIAGTFVTGLSRTAGHIGTFITQNASAFLAYQAEL